VELEIQHKVCQDVGCVGAVDARDPYAVVWNNGQGKYVRQDGYLGKAGGAAAGHEGVDCALPAGELDEENCDEDSALNEAEIEDPHGDVQLRDFS
jgi:hypothetical protein